MGSPDSSFRVSRGRSLRRVMGTGGIRKVPTVLVRHIDLPDPGAKKRIEHIRCPLRLVSASKSIFSSELSLLMSR